MQEDIMIEVHASWPRRLFGVGTMIVLGMAILYLAAAGGGPSLGARLILATLGLGAFGLAMRMWLASGQHLVLTETELRTSSGELLTTLSDIDSLDRGMFAFKPSNGFILRLKTTQSARWAPGIWWRVGRRIGVGGITYAPQVKAMSVVIIAQIAERAVDQ